MTEVGCQRSADYAPEKYKEHDFTPVEHPEGTQFNRAQRGRLRWTKTVIASRNGEMGKEKLEVRKLI